MKFSFNEVSSGFMTIKRFQEVGGQKVMFLVELGILEKGEGFAENVT